MSQPERIQPDLQFVKELQGVGGDTLKKCYQCATCSVACPLAPAENPYPRKEMVWAQWGLKDRLVNDIDIWLCHNCGTCSDLCPRGAKPGDLLAALRNMAYRKLVKPTIVGEWMSSAKGLPMLAGIPAAIYAVIWLLRSFSVGFLPRFAWNDKAHEWVVDNVNGKVVYGGLFPGDFTIDPVFSALAIFVAYTFYVGVKNLYAGFASAPRTFVIGKKDEVTWLQAVQDVCLSEVATHAKWKQCGYETEGDEQKFKGHFALFYGFVALAIVTSIVAVAHWGGKVIHFLSPIGHTPMALYNPVKLLALVGAGLLLYGLTMLTKRRLSQDPTVHGSSFYDWYLLGVIWAVGLTGVFSMLLRWANIAILAYPMYYIHLISVFMLIGYLPWSKLGHLVYRTAALVYARKNGRVPMQPNEENIFVI